MIKRIFFFIKKYLYSILAICYLLLFICISLISVKIAHNVNTTKQLNYYLDSGVACDSEIIKVIDGQLNDNYVSNMNRFKDLSILKEMKLYEMSENLTGDDKLDYIMSHNMQKIHKIYPNVVNGFVIFKQDDLQHKLWKMMKISAKSSK